MKNHFLFDDCEDEDFIYNKWEEEWQDMPAFKQKNLEPYQTIKIHFKSKKDREEFAKLINQKLYKTTKSVWYPKLEIERYVDKEYIDQEDLK